MILTALGPTQGCHTGNLLERSAPIKINRCLRARCAIDTRGSIIWRPWQGDTSTFVNITLRYSTWMNKTHISFLFNTVFFFSIQFAVHKLCIDHSIAVCSCDTCYSEMPKHQQSCVHILGHAAALLGNCSRWKRPRLCLSLFNLALSGLCGIFSKQCIVAAKCAGVLYQCSAALLADDPKTSHLPCFLNK